jgi:hypothetical protein
MVTQYVMRWASELAVSAHETLETIIDNLRSRVGLDKLEHICANTPFSGLDLGYRGRLQTVHARLQPFVRLSTLL